MTKIQTPFDPRAVHAPISTHAGISCSALAAPRSFTLKLNHNSIPELSGGENLPSYMECVSTLSDVLSYSQGGMPMHFCRYLTHFRASGGYAESFLSLFDAPPYFQGGVCQCILVAV